jgi:DNA polymerase-3 subunit alpha
MPPDINKSAEGFSLEPNQLSLENKGIRFGLTAIKNVGESAIDQIMDTRSEGGNFTSFTNFCHRVDTRKANKKVIESLIYSGCFNQFGNHNTLIHALDTIRSKVISSKDDGQSSLFDTEVGSKISDVDNFNQLPEMPLGERLIHEKELIGVYLTEHPQAAALKIILNQINTRIEDLEPGPKQNIQLGGIITRIHQVMTKTKNQPMAFATLDDGTGKIDVVIFPKIYAKYRDSIGADNAVIISGDLDNRDEKPSLLATSITVIEPFGDSEEVTIPQPTKDSIVIEIPRNTPKDILTQLGSALKSHPGDMAVKIVIPNGGNMPKCIDLPYKIDYSLEVRTIIDKLVGK